MRSACVVVAGHGPRAAAAAASAWFLVLLVAISAVPSEDRQSQFIPATALDIVDIVGVAFVDHDVHVS